MNSMRLDFLNKYGLPLSLRENFPQSLEKVRHEKVDILLGNHPGSVDTAGKSARMKTEEKNPFIDSSELERFLAVTRKQYDDMIASGK